MFQKEVVATGASLLLVTLLHWTRAVAPALRRHSESKLAPGSVLHFPEKFCFRESSLKRCKGREGGRLSLNQNKPRGTPKAFGAVRWQATKIE